MKKVLSGLMLAALLATSILFVNCSEDDSEDYSINKKSASTTESESVLIARCLKGSDAIELSFDVDTVARQTEDAIKHKYSTEIVVEEISVFDQNPNSLESASGLIFSVFVPSNGVSNKMFVPLEKYNDEDGNVVYKLSELKITVSCTGTNCNGGCQLITENGQAKGCTECKNDKGTCISKTEGETVDAWWIQVLNTLKDMINININVEFKAL